MRKMKDAVMTISGRAWLWMIVGASCIISGIVGSLTGRGRGDLALGLVLGFAVGIIGLKEAARNWRNARNGEPPVEQESAM